MIISAITFLTLLLIYDVVRTKNSVDRITKILIYSTFIEFGYNSSAIQTSIRDFSQSELFQFFGFLYLSFLIIKLRVPAKKSFLTYYIFFLLTVIFSNIILALDPSPLEFPRPGDSLDELASNTLELTKSSISNDHYLRVFRILLLYPFLHMICANKFNKKLIVHLSRKYLFFLIVILCFEFLLKISGNSIPYEMIYGVLTNQNMSENLLQLRGGLPTLHGLTQEPSHLAYAFLFPLLIFSNALRGRALGLVSTLFLIVSGSFRSFVVGIFIALKNFKINQLLFLALIGVLTLSILNLSYLSLMFDRFHGLINIDVDASSTSIRIVSWKYAVDAFQNHPFFGVGLGSISTSSGLLGALASVGLIGVIAYCRLIVKVYDIKVFSYNLGFLVFFFLFSFNVHILYSFPIINLFLYSKIND